MPEKREILIVEDAEENVVFLSQILEDHGYAFRVARNGEEAIAALKTHRPDAVLLDIMMPRKTGITVYKELKADPALETVPVIVVTGASEITGVDIRTGEAQPKEDYGDEVARDIGKFYHEKFKDVEPDGFIEKPIDPPALVKKLAELL
jgi:twitching motility two-component system response regulator PilH